MAVRLGRVLVVEDDLETAADVIDCLKNGGYDVDLASDAAEGLRLGCANEYLVMTIDRLLPGADGLEIIKSLRDVGIATPALVISALGEISDRVRGLRAGGDDYLVKPFAFAELLARVDALAKRSAAAAKATTLRIGDLEMDLLSRSVRRGGRVIELLPREFQVLEYLVRNAEQVVPRTVLLQKVWDVHLDPMSNVIDVYVGRLRRKLDSNASYSLIHTVRGVGFRLRVPD